MGGRNLHSAGDPVMVSKEGIDVVRGDLAGCHCLDHRGGTRNRIPASKQVPQARDAAGKVRLDGPSADRDSDGFEGLGDDGLADGHDDGITGEAPFRQVRFHRVGPVLAVIGADVLGLGPESCHLAVSVRLDPAGSFQGDDLAAFRHGRMDFFFQGGHIFQPPPVDALDGSGSQAFGRAGGIHGYVAPADDADPLAGEIWYPAFPDVPEQSDRTVDSLGLFSFQMELLVAVGPDGDVDRVIPLLELFDGKVRPHGYAGVDLDPCRKDVSQVFVQDLQGQPIVGDAVPEHAAQLGPLFVDGDAVPHEGQVIGSCQASRAAADYSHCLAGSRGRGRRQGRFGMVHSEPLQSADVHRIIYHLPAAVEFAGMFTDVGTDRWERIVLADQFQGLFVMAFPDQGDIAGDIHMGRAGGDTGYWMAESADTAAVEHMFFIIFPEASDSLQHHIRCLIADGTVRRISDHLGSILDQIDGFQGRRPFQHLLDQGFQLSQPHPARDTFPAALGMAEAQEIQRHIHRTEPRRTGTDPAVHILIQAVQDRLGPSRGLDLQTTHDFLPL